MCIRDRASDNDKYVNTDAEGKYSLAGSIFLDYRNQKDFTDFNSILYGHHMADHAMFGDLADFKNRTFFDAHPSGNLYYGGSNHKVDFFAFLEADAYDSTKMCIRDRSTSLPQIIGNIVILVISVVLAFILNKRVTLKPSYTEK